LKIKYINKKKRAEKKLALFFFLLKYLWTRVRISPPSPATGFVPFTVGFDASGSTVSTPPITNYAWDFNGDGTTDATGITTVHTFTTVGTYLLQLTVTDSAAKTYVAFVTVIANEAS
jgi:PKD repeat protein